MPANCWASRRRRRAGTSAATWATRPIRKKSMTHNTRNVGQTPFHNVVVALMPPKAERFAPAARDVPGYTQVLDNDRVRAWKLTLEPGQASGVITQKAPGLRIVVDGGEIAEIVPGEPDRGMMLRLGRLLLAGAGGDPRGPQHRHDAHRAGRS